MNRLKSMRFYCLLFSFLCLLPLTSFGAALQESLMSPEHIMKSHMGYDSDIERQAMMAFLPRAQQILIIRNQLVSILESYARSNPAEVETTKKMIELIEKTFPQDKKSGETGYLDVFFEYSPKGFQVDGIEADRLAINTGSDIRFNIVGLQKKENLSLADVTQLWLHELSHFDKKTPLATRDQWIAKVTQWVQERSTEFQLPNGKKLFSLIVPAPLTGPETISRGRGSDSYNSQPQTLYANNIKKSFILLQQDSQRTRFYEEAYDGFHNFDNVINKGIPDWNQRFSYDSVTVNWPTIQVRSIKMLPNKKLQLDYGQASTLYERDANRADTFYRIQGFSSSTVLPSFPENSYRVEVDTESDALDVKRNYSLPVNEGDFELYQVRDKGNSRFVSLRLKVTDVQNKIKGAPSLHLIAKDLMTSELLSFEVKKIHFLNKDEAYLHVKIPNRNLELTQLLFPVVDRYGKYSEIKLLPSKPFSLFGPGDAPIKKVKLKSMEIQEKQFEEDRVRAELPLTSNRKVIAVTIDLEHTLMGLAASSPQMGGSKDLIPVGEGRKYYVKGEDLETKNDVLSIAIPEADIQQVKPGSTISHRIGFYSYDEQTHLVTIKDTGERHLRAVWMHFADGTVEKVPESKLPQQNFSFNFDPNSVTIKKCNDLFNGMSKADAAWLEFRNAFVDHWP